MGGGRSDAPGFPDAPPAAAPFIGPFADPFFLETIWERTALPGQRLVVLADGRGGLSLVEETGAASLVGHEDLVDYRSPRGEVAGLLADYLRGPGRGRRIRFDSLPREAALVLAAALEEAGVVHAVSPHTTAAVMRLPDSYEDYLYDLGKKQRHETRRKLRRFRDGLGTPSLTTHHRPGPHLERFFELHRMADGAKGSFMTPRMQALFTDLLTGEGWRLDALSGEDGEMAAASFGYADRQGYYLYNSSYNPQLRDESPGAALLALLVERAIGEGRTVFDFLKGDETYKYRMGARARPLYLIEGAT